MNNAFGAIRRMADRLASGSKSVYERTDRRAEIRFVRGRLKFGGSRNSAPFPSMVCVF